MSQKSRIVDHSRLVTRLAKIVGQENVLSSVGDRASYQRDANPLEGANSLCTVLPANTSQVSDVVKACNAAAVPFVARGAGTGLAGGAIVQDGVVIGLARMNRILEIDLRNRRLTAEAGAVNVMLSKAVSTDSFLYAPDPSSQGASTLGGNIANNAGGPHTLKYGVTVNHLMAVEFVLPDGDVISIGDKTEDTNGYDLLGLICGGEGTLGIVTQATVRLTPAPEAIQTFLAIFQSVEEASQVVSEIVSSGITPAALELMDSVILQSVEDAFHFGFPRDAGAILIIEIDGLQVALVRTAERIHTLCMAGGAREIRIASEPQQRAKLWAARKKAVGTLGRLAPGIITQDGVIPRSQLPCVLAKITQIAARGAVRIANVFHAGDGNLHPVVLFDPRVPGEVERVKEVNREILELCVRVGGTLSGEHGIGAEKRDFMPLLFSGSTLDTMARIRDCFNPNGLCNPHKILPASHGCSFEITREVTHN